MWEDYIVFGKIFRLLFWLFGGVMLYILPKSTGQANGANGKQGTKTTSIVTTGTMSGPSSESDVPVTTSSTVTAQDDLRLQVPLTATSGLAANRDNSPTESDPLVGWIYYLDKPQIQSEMMKYNLDINGKLTDLRKRFVAFLRERGSQPEFNKITRDSTSLWRADNEHRSFETGPQHQLHEGSVIREMLGLAPDISFETVKRMLSFTISTGTDPATGAIGEDGNEKVHNKPPHTAVTYSTQKPRVSISCSPNLREHEQNQERMSDSASLCSTVRKWNLRFDGVKEPISFLERLDELLDSYEICKDNVLKALPELFQGSALLWYRNNREIWSTYYQFRREFEVQFFPPGYRQNLDAEIRRRTQGANEPFRTFAVSMLTLMRRRGGFSPDEKLNILYSNMKPEYKLTIKQKEITSVSDMIEHAEHYEGYLRAQDSYQAPPLPKMSLVPETAYQPKGRHDWINTVVEAVPEVRCTNKAKINPPLQYRTNVPKVNQDDSRKGQTGKYFRRYNQRKYPTNRPGTDARPSDQNNQTRPGPNNHNRSVVCWNCDGEGHVSRECRKPKVMRCFYCKKMGIRTTSCDCRAGNGAGTQSTGVRLSLETDV